MIKNRNFLIFKQRPPPFPGHTGGGGEVIENVSPVLLSNWECNVVKQKVSNGFVHPISLPRLSQRLTTNIKVKFRIRSCNCSVCTDPITFIHTERKPRRFQIYSQVFRCANKNRCGIRTCRLEFLAKNVQVRVPHLSLLAMLWTRRVLRLSGRFS